MFLNWLRNTSDRILTQSSRKARRNRRFALPIEELESRSMLSAAAGSAWTPFGASPTPTVIITFDAKGGVTVTNTGVGPYDSDDDTYIGVVNNSSKPINSLKVSAPNANDIFGFDGDGIQTYGSPVPAITSPNGYEGPDNFFTNVTQGAATSVGTVNFIGGLPKGRQTYFSLEGVPETVNVGVDLKLTVNDATITPTKATDLHLDHFYGGEQVRIPVSIEDIGADPANGAVTLKGFVSTTPDLKGVIGTAYTKNLNVNLAPAGHQNVNFDITLNKTAQLKAGQKYYFVVQLDSKKIKESDKQNGVDLNNIAASTTKFEYVGKPGKPGIFSSGKYTGIIRDTLNSVDPFANQGASVPTTGPEFTATFESPGGFDSPNLAPYHDSKNIPTIGIGINLQNIDSSIKHALATDVRSFYHSQAANHAAGYKNIDKLNDNQVITMLKNQASAAARTGDPAQDAFTPADAQSLFNTLYTKHQTAAEKAVGATVWASLSTDAQWVLTDIDFNVGSLTKFKGLVADLNAAGGPDFVRAGFDFIDSARTNQVQRDRTLAGYEYLLSGHTSDIGNLV